MQDLITKEQECINSIEEIFENLFKFGKDRSTYLINRFHPIIYNGKSAIINSSKYPLYMRAGETLAVIQLAVAIWQRGDLVKPVQFWEPTCKRLLPDWRRHYIEYTSIKKYYEELPLIKHTILGILLTSERIDAFRNFGWKVATYLRKKPKDYNKKIREAYIAKSQDIWYSNAPHIEYEDFIKIS